MALIYGLTFCRLVIGLAFALSALSKARDIPAFEQAIVSFRLLPQRYIPFAARFFLGAEFVIVLLMLFGGSTLWFGFGLALILLLVFSVALVLVFIRKIHTSCNCFGPNENLISPADVWRNAGFILCALGGCGILAAPKQGQVGLGLVEWGVIGLAAAVFVLIWIRIGDIVHIFQQSS